VSQFDRPLQKHIIAPNTVDDGENHQVVRFLVADDQDSARKMMRQVVSNVPLWSVVCEATDGSQAVAGMDHKPDVVLMDILMPGMNGIEAMQQIKRLAPETIVILTTAYRNHEFKTRSLQAGADGFILKDDLTTDTLHNILYKARRT
jgi:DNA-binding NarL/FixJ family response regulator